MATLIEWMEEIARRIDAASGSPSFTSEEHDEMVRDIEKAKMQAGDSPTELDQDGAL